MIIKSMIKERNYRSIVASTSEYVYNAWRRANTLRFYALSNQDFNVINHFFTVHIGNGEIRLVVDDLSITLYSHDELINTIRYAFPDHEWHDIITIIETLLYKE